jgi:hypothetical protein
MPFSCDVGDVPQIKVVWTTAAGVAVDPTTITLYLRVPSGSVGTYTYASGSVAKLSTGTYTYNGTVTQAGYHNVRWVADGSAVAAQQDRYYAREVNT